VGLNRAVALLADAAANGKGKAGTSGPIKVLGEHPALGGKVEVLSGRYGPYIKFGKVNATIPKDMTPEAVTMEDAVRLIAARQEAGGSAKKKMARKAKAAKPKTAAPNGKAGTSGSAKAAKSGKAAASKRISKAAGKAT